MGCGSASKPIKEAPKEPLEPQLNAETSVSRLNGLKLILSGNGSRKAFGVFMCTERLPSNWNKFMVSVPFFCILYSLLIKNYVNVVEWTFVEGIRGG